MAQKLKQVVVTIRRVIRPDDEAYWDEEALGYWPDVHLLETFQADLGSFLKDAKWTISRK